MSQTATFQLQGMRCAACAASIERAIAKVPGVESCQVNFALEQAAVTYQETVNSETIKDAVDRVGYHATPLPKTGQRESTDPENDIQAQRQRQFKRKLTVGVALSSILFFGSLPMMVGVTFTLFSQLAP